MAARVPAIVATLQPVKKKNGRGKNRVCECICFKVRLPS